MSGERKETRNAIPPNILWLAASEQHLKTLPRLEIGGAHFGIRYRLSLAPTESAKHAPTDPICGVSRILQKPLNQSIARRIYSRPMSEIIFLVEEAAEGGYTAKALGAPIFTEADTLDELHTNVRDAVQCHFDDGKAPSVIRLHFVRDEVIAL